MEHQVPNINIQLNLPAIFIRVYFVGWWGVLRKGNILPSAVRLVVEGKKIKHFKKCISKKKKVYIHIKKINQVITKYILINLRKCSIYTFFWSFSTNPMGFFSASFWCLPKLSRSWTAWERWASSTAIVCNSLW